MSKKSKGQEISATVEESNEMRKKLGIKPLDESKPKAKEQHAPAPGRGDKAAKPSEEEVKKRIAASKNKREHEELTAGEGIADIIAREEGTGGASDWVNRTRNKDGTMKGAAAAASAAEKSRKRKAEEAVDKAPAAMKVRHDMSQLQQGDTTMTLADKPILNKDGEIEDDVDELANVRMADDDKAVHHEALKKQKEYDPDKEGQDILSKYDELKTGPAGFLIGGTTMGVISEQDPEKRLQILTALNERQSCETGLKVQKDFLTSAEMAKFRKIPKKKTKRRQRGDAKDKEDQISAPGAGPMVLPGRPADAGSDEEDPELYEQLSKQRRLVRRSDAGAVRKGEAALGAVSERISSIPKPEPEEKDENAPKGGLNNKGKEGEVISLTATTEFCNVVQTPLEKMETLKHEAFRGSTLYKQQATQRKGVKADTSGARGKREALGPEEIKAQRVAEEEYEELGLTEEELDLSCASGLAYLRARSQIGNDQESHKFRKLDNRPLEMSTVDGDIKLEYRDDFGRVQTPKEAFRAISWKFHGKVPGRKNMERRLLRLENEMKLKSMDAVVQLPTVRALNHVQSSDAKPYMVLSGANEK